MPKLWNRQDLLLLRSGGYSRGDNPMHPGLWTEMQEKADVELAHAEVIEQLTLSDRREEFGGLNLYRNPTLDQHVQAKEADFNATVDNLDRYFLPSVQPLTR